MGVKTIKKYFFDQKSRFWGEKRPKNDPFLGQNDRKIDFFDLKPIFLGPKITGPKPLDVKKFGDFREPSFAHFRRKKRILEPI